MIFSFWYNRFMKKIPFIITYILLIVCTTNTVHAISQKSLSKKINKLDNNIVEEMPIPILLGVTVDNLNDTWGDARSGGHTHEGIDIFATRNSIIVSPTEAVVTKITDQGLGGVQVWTANPGDESFYYAHLESVYPILKVGDELDPGDIIGYVGNSGNASLASPHLHLGIYTEDGAINPYERLTSEFSLQQKIKTLTSYLEYLQDEFKKKNT